MIEIASDRVDDETQVVTASVDLHDRWHEGWPQEYETRIVGGRFSGDSWRSPTRAEALEWHAHILGTYRTRVR